MPTLGPAGRMIDNGRRFEPPNAATPGRAPLEISMSEPVLTPPACGEKITIYNG